MSSRKKILIVDDEPDMVAWLKAFFEDNGFDTVSAPDGVEGLRKVRDEKPDLITLDVTMDKESGVKMYKNLSEDEETSKIPVVMITGVTPEFKHFIESRRRVPPPTAYFEKPVDKAALLAKINEILG